MSLVVVGSLAIDSVITPKGEAMDCLGGSASFFSYCASFFGPVRLVGVVGEDFPREYLKLFEGRGNIDTSGIQHAPGKTFRWKGKYSEDMNSRETLEVHLNVFGEFDPVVPDHFRDSKYVFLGNASPVVQRKVLHQIAKPKLVVMDTMDLWIETQRDELCELLREVDGVVLNDSEALLLTQKSQLVSAGLGVLAMGPKFVVVKKGEHGAMLFSDKGIAALPAFPVANLVDPTGAGDSFAGGMMGYLASQEDHDHGNFKRALAFGTVTASLTVEDFSLNRLKASSRSDLETRYVVYRDMLDVR
jgi:sugar/nucleoside kinase (ribokinase family)